MPSIAEIFNDMTYGPAPEADAPAQAWLDGHQRRFGHFIGGAWQNNPEQSHFSTINPANKQVLAEISQGTAQDVDAAVKAAQEAAVGWAALGGHARARHLYALARAVQRHSRLFAVLETLDNGKPIRETRDIDIPLVARHWYHHAGWAQLLESEFAGHQALGVVGAIIPWNFPLLIMAWKVAPALAAGNTVVLKPAEFTPLTALLFAEIAAQAGLPPGVLNVVTGDGETGKLMVNHAGLNKIAFTGSTEVGKQIRKATAGSGKKIGLELGGKSPFMVFEDADIDSVIEGVVDAIWFNQGQVCCAGSRLLVQENIADKLVQKLKLRMESLRVGNPLDKAIDMGAIIDQSQLDRITTLVDLGVSEGAERWQPSWSCPTEGYFYPPTLLTNIAPASIVAQQEIFGPVISLMTFRTPSEAVALANNTRYGLAASIWSENINLALDIAPKIKAGVVWINCTNQFDAAAGFGGYRESGYGREGGREGLWDYLKPSFVRPAALGELTVRTGEFPSPLPSKPAMGMRSSIDRTAKLYIGGKQARPDSGYSLRIDDSYGRFLGEVGEGNRKDLRNAVEAAHASVAWRSSSGHSRAQILYYLAENLAVRQREFAERLMLMGSNGQHEVAASIERLFHWAAWADKYDGAVHNVPIRAVALAMHEPIGVMALVCPDTAPLLGLISLLAPAMAMGNSSIVIPSEQYPLAATDFYSVLETSDVPAGVVNIVTGKRDVLAKTLAEHDDVEGIWYAGSEEGAAMVELASAINVKRTWVLGERDWFNPNQAASREFLREAVQVKNIWIPYGE
jgi:aldehyde dehydrogenase (NAD+)